MKKRNLFFFFLMNNLWEKRPRTNKMAHECYSFIIAYCSGKKQTLCSKSSHIVLSGIK
jgi:hypothetical protein